MRSSDTSDTFKDVEMLKKLPQSASMMMKNSCQDDCSRNTSGTGAFSHKHESSEFLSPDYVGNDSQNALLQHSYSRNNNESLSQGNSKDLEENSSTQNLAKHAECSIDGVEHPSLGSVINNEFDHPKSRALDSVSVLQNNRETLQSQTSEESDVVEDDVKVCDICGDTGREEMLAICSRCSDGAEHTYCMRIMLDKVPEGDWLCEECQLKEDAEKLKSEISKVGTATPKEPLVKEKGSGGTLSAKPSLKLDYIEDEVEANKTPKVTPSSILPAKRNVDNLEEPSKSKKLSSETTTGAPTPGSPCYRPLLPCENSSKSIDLAKVKQGNLLSSSGSQSFNNSSRFSGIATSESPKTQALQSPRGLLSRSTTFNGLSSKSKVKQLVDEAFLKQKLARESYSNVTRKEGLNVKASSLRMPSAFHSSVVDSKPKLRLCLEDGKGLKQTKEPPLIETKNSFKVDRQMASSSAGVTSTSVTKSDQKTVFRESIEQFAPVSNSHGPNTPQHGGKQDYSYKGSEKLLASDGASEVRKQTSFCGGLGIPISKGKLNSVEKKPCQISPKDDVAVKSCLSDESYGNLDVQQHGLLQPHESKKQDGKIKDSKQTISNSGKSIRCHRCNDFGHSAQFCSASSLRFSTPRAPSARSTGELSHKSTKWKDAVDAISRSRLKDLRLPDQSDDLSLSSTELSGDIASKDQVSSSSISMRNLSSVDGNFDGREALRSSLVDSGKTCNIKQHPSHSRENPREANSNAIFSIPDERKVKPYIMKMLSLAAGTANFSRISAIPERDYIWQGCFEVQRSGRLFDCCDGIQAHISTCASRRVLEVVKKFPSKVRMEEVPRMSLWPIQFQGSAKEDNIALYFFAKDLESYERNYKMLLDNMLKNDLALKGNIDRIQLLIFPSNQLPEKSQRWNKLFFLWAIFRERKVTYSEYLLSSLKKPCGASLGSDPPVQVPRAAEVNTSQKSCSFEEKFEKLSMYGSSYKTPKALDLPFLSSSQREDGNCEMKLPSLDPRPVHLREHGFPTPDVGTDKQVVCSIPEIYPSAGASQQTGLRGRCSLSSKARTNAPRCPEVEGNRIYLDVTGESKSERYPLLQPCDQPTLENGHSKGKFIVSDSDASDCKGVRLIPCAAVCGVTSSPSQKLPVSSSLPEEASSKEGCRLTDIVPSSQPERTKEIAADRPSSDLRSSKKRPHDSFSDAILDTSGEMRKGSVETMVWKDKPCSPVDGENNCKKLKSSIDVNIQTSVHEQVLGAAFSSKMLIMDRNSVTEQNGMKACDADASIGDNSITTERYLFPVDSGHVKDLKSGNNIPWQILSSDDEDLSETDAPNLELALGGEKKQPKQGALPLFGQLVAENTKQKKLLYSATDDGGDDLSASLSLSLSFPFSEKGQPAKSVSKTEKVLPKRHHVNTSLLLFGGSLTDT